MQIYKITKADINESREYIGTLDFSKTLDGHLEIEAGLGFVKFSGSVLVRGRIAALAGSGIEAGEGIKAGWGIEAGSGIEAGEGIKAGWGISCKLVLAFRFRLFAGTSIYLKNASKTVTCGKLEGGELAYGDLTETGLPEPEPTPEISSSQDSQEVSA